MSPGLHPRPLTQASRCPRRECGGSVSQLSECAGNGKIPENYGRWYQMCYSCNRFIWYHDPTPLDLIPDHIKARLDQPSSPVAATAASGQTILCSEDGCFNISTGQSRKANTNCKASPRRCSQCCKARGGCGLSSHSAVPSQKPTSIMPIQSLVEDGHQEKSTVASSSMLPAPSMPTQSSQSAAEPSRVFFRRAMSASYANVYKAAHQLNEERNKAIQERQLAEADYARRLKVILWNKKDKRPEIFNVVTQSLGYFIVSKHPLLVQALHDSQSVAVWHTDEMQWIVQELKAPLRVTEHATVLIRLPDLDLEDCLDVDREIQLVSDVSGSLSVTKDSRGSVSSGKSRALSSPSPMDVDEAATGEKSNSSIITLKGASTRATATPLAKKIQPFPLKYVIDMHHGLQQMVKLVGQSADVHRKKFLEYFPGSKYVKQTFNRARNVYIRGTEANLVLEYVSFGRTPEGKWSAFVKAVNDCNPPKGRLEVTVKREASESLDVIEVDDDDEVPSSPVASGSSKITVIDNNPIEIDDSPELANKPLPRTSRAELDATSMVIGAYIYKGWTAVIQPWVSHRKNTLYVSKMHVCTPGSHAETLAALSHFSYNHSNFKQIIVDFEGRLDDLGTLTIFSARTHAVNEGIVGREEFYIGNLGGIGIDYFKDRHVCSPICQALGLLPF
ncbi:hypothetical protein CVT26_007227 [Gymnopilus dilepis]|uniref:Alpha-type protein kinase domain-containing protein n=1 Tax=Gymnopilus dilepis TaxID=231916 RepID=A0A409VMG4_9AGAR|nr:hypothetical protein CVT26_007227 [Gymnopilus dilepis]